MTKFLIIIRKFFYKIDDFLIFVTSALVSFYLHCKYTVFINLILSCIKFLYSVTTILYIYTALYCIFVSFIMIYLFWFYVDIVLILMLYFYTSLIKFIFFICLYTTYMKNNYHLLVHCGVSLEIKNI